MKKLNTYGINSITNLDEHGIPQGDTMSPYLFYYSSRV